jgi:hypothetical protein
MQGKFSWELFVNSSWRKDSYASPKKEVNMLGTILIIILILMLIGSLPVWPYSGSWGYRPGGLLGFLLVVIIILVIAGII